ncbi:hypothetical protein [Thiomicrospira microaerophila]|uniref:hypothetical protein n=1 Tax=Thiomicrospira microaerophila TaxID=406020 RepID=UPI0005C99D1D|nr:hypothetical protein [Thiomicrospira microaerophila]
MYAIEFETVVRDHLIRLPNDVPEDCPVKVLVLYETPFKKMVVNKKKRKPHPMLKGTVKSAADLMSSALPSKDWAMLK